MSFMMDEEDYVVQELPVFLSKTLAENLHIFQYPTKPSRENFNKAHVLNSLIKPKNQEVKLEFALDLYSDRYSASKGEEIALRVDHNNQGSPSSTHNAIFNSGTMDKVCYKSTLPLSNTLKYAIAVIKDREVHITPIKSMLQLRPSFSYLEKQEKRQKEMNGDPGSSDEEEPEQITVKFARQESDVAKKLKASTYEYHKQKYAQEPWYDGVWWKSDSDCADLERLKLFPCTSDWGSALSLPKKQYLLKLVPPPPADEDESARLGNLEVKPRDLRAIQALSLSDQCREILKEAKILPYYKMRRLVRAPDRTEVSDSAMIQALSTGACFVRGLWTIKSSDLYARPSANSGVPANVMATSRDYVIYLFTKSDYVDRRKVAAALKLPPHEVLEILESVAALNPRTGWELMYPPDHDFEKKHPDLVQRQTLYWEAKQRQFNEMLTNEVTPKRQRKKSQKESFSSENSFSPKNINLPLDEDAENRKRLKTKSNTGAGKRNRKISEVVNESAVP